MRKEIVLILFLVCYQFYGQKLDWACGGQQVSLNWDYSSLGKDNSIVVGGHSDQLSYLNGEQGLFESDGNRIMEFVPGRTEIIFCFSSAGKLKWQLNFSSEYTSLCGIACDKSGTTWLLLFAGESAEDEKENPKAMIPEIKGDQLMNPGYYLASFNEKGEYKSLVRTDLLAETDLEVSEFKIHPGGNFIVCGSSGPGKISKSLSIKEGAGGGDFVLMMNGKGLSLWADAISFRSNSCCSRPSELCRMSIDEAGAVYLGGTYIYGAEFGGKIVKMAPQKYEPNKYNDAEESYVASYLPSGKLNWVTTSQCRGRLSSIAASKKNIAVGFNSWQTAKAFGEKFDTSNKKLLVIVIFDNKGKVQKTISPHGSAEDMLFDKENNLVVTGLNGNYNYKNRKSKRLYFAGDSIEGMNCLIMATFSVKGEIKSFFQANVPVETSNEPMRFLMGTDGRFYFSGQMFAGLPIDLSIYDTAFKAGKIYGGSPFVARVSRALKKE